MSIKLTHYKALNGRENGHTAPPVIARHAVIRELVERVLNIRAYRL